MKVVGSALLFCRKHTYCTAGIVLITIPGCPLFSSHRSVDHSVICQLCSRSLFLFWHAHKRLVHEWSTDTPWLIGYAESDIIYPWLLLLPHSLSHFLFPSLSNVVSLFFASSFLLPFFFFPQLRSQRNRLIRENIIGYNDSAVKRYGTRSFENEKPPKRVYLLCPRKQTMK